MTDNPRRRIRQSAATAVDINLRDQLEEPGADYAFDMAMEMLDEITQRSGIEDLIEKVRASTGDAADALLSSFGEQYMALVIELGDGKYLDRTGVLVKRVAERTGIWFPDTFRRYIEMSVLGLKPLDRCNVVRATTKEYVLQQYSCAVMEKLKGGDLPCQSLCLASFRAAAKQVGHHVDIALTKRLPKDDMCEFCFRPAAAD